MKKRILTYLLYSTLILCITSLSFIANASEQTSTTSSKNIPQKATRAKANSEKQRENSYKKSQKNNSDVVGWIYLPNTQIDYPVLCSRDNTYYLTRNENKKATKAGSIFMDYRNTQAENQRNIILYGHNMSNGTMFHSLNNYKVKKFFDKNRLITFYFGDEKRQYEIYAAYAVNVELNIIQVEFTSDESFLSYARNLQGISAFETDPRTILCNEDEILTLMTCTYEYDDMRYIVQARRINSEEKS